MLYVAILFGDPSACKGRILEKQNPPLPVTHANLGQIGNPSYAHWAADERQPLSRIGRRAEQAFAKVVARFSQRPDFVAASPLRMAISSAGCVYAAHATTDFDANHERAGTYLLLTLNRRGGGGLRSPKSDTMSVVASDDRLGSFGGPLP